MKEWIDIKLDLVYTLSLSLSKGAGVCKVS